MSVLSQSWSWVRLREAERGDAACTQARLALDAGVSSKAGGVDGAVAVLGDAVAVGGEDMGATDSQQDGAVVAGSAMVASVTNGGCAVACCRGAGGRTCGGGGCGGGGVGGEGGGGGGGDEGVGFGARPQVVAARRRKCGRAWRVRGRRRRARMAAVDLCAQQGGFVGRCGGGQVGQGLVNKSEGLAAGLGRALSITVKGPGGAVQGQSIKVRGWRPG